MPLKYAEAQNATTPRIGEHLGDKVNQKMTEIKTNHPELGALADRMQTYECHGSHKRISSNARVRADDDGRSQELAR